MRISTNTQENTAPGVNPTSPWRIVKAVPFGDYRLRVTFIDGTEGEVDLSNLVNRTDAGVFAVLRNNDIFDRVTIHLGTITWPGEIDLAPDAIHEAIKKSGKYKI